MLKCLTLVCLPLMGDFKLLENGFNFSPFSCCHYISLFIFSLGNDEEMIVNTLNAHTFES